MGRPLYQLVSEGGAKLLEPKSVRASDLVGKKGYVKLGEYKPNIEFIEPETPPERMGLLFSSNMDSANLARLFTGVYIRCSSAWPKGTRNCVNPLVPAKYEVSLTDFPNVAGHIKDAIEIKGKPSTLTKNNPRNGSNRNAACSPASQRRLREEEPPPTNMTRESCDKYPFNSAIEGGANASIRWVPLQENTKQGNHLHKFYREQQVQRGYTFTVKVIP